MSRIEEIKMPRWTDDEDQAFVELLSEYVLKDGLSYAASVKRIAEDLGRPIGGCDFRWNTQIRKHLPEDDELIQQIKANNTANKVLLQIRS